MWINRRTVNLFYSIFYNFIFGVTGFCDRHVFDYTDLVNNMYASFFYLLLIFLVYLFVQFVRFGIMNWKRLPSYFKSFYILICSVGALITGTIFYSFISHWMFISRTMNDGNTSAVSVFSTMIIGIIISVLPPIILAYIIIQCYKGWVVFLEEVNKPD